MKRIGLGLVVALGIWAALSGSNAQATHYYGGNRWLGWSVDWCFGNSLPSSWQTQYRSAADTWNGSPSRFSLNWYTGSACTGVLNSAGSSNTFTENGWPNDPGMTINAYDQNGYIIRKRSWLNTDFAWSTTMAEGSSMGSSTNKCSPSCDVKTIILHEFGHWVRFTHGGCDVSPKSTMCVDWKVRRSINSHDSSSLVAIYG